jgi:hypothetical protein
MSYVRSWLVRLCRCTRERAYLYRLAIPLRSVWPIRSSRRRERAHLQRQRLKAVGQVHPLPQPAGLERGGTRSPIAAQLAGGFDVVPSVSLAILPDAPCGFGNGCRRRGSGCRATIS